MAEGDAGDTLFYLSASVWPQKLSMDLLCRDWETVPLDEFECERLGFSKKDWLRFLEPK